MIAVLALLLMIPASSWAWTVTERCELAQETPKGTVTISPGPSDILMYLPEGLVANGNSVSVSIGSRNWRTNLVGGAVELKGGTKPLLEKNWATVRANGDQVFGFNLAGSSEVWEQARDCDPAVDGRGWVSLVGEITASTDDEIIRAIRRRRPEGLVLDSPGGLAEEAQRIGNAVRKAGLATMVRSDGRCLSECTFILAAGKPRTVEEYGRVGISADLVTKGIGFFPGDHESVAGSAVYFSGMGVDGGKLAVMAISARRDDIKVLTPEELRSVGFIDTSAPLNTSSTTGRLPGNAVVDWWFMGALLAVVVALGWGLTKIRRRA